MPLRQLYPDPKSSASGDAAKVDIIAVHGLNPRSKNDADHAWDTWRKPAGPQGRLWLRDDLPEYVPESRIFLYEYNSTAVYGKDRSTFVGKANELLEAIRVEREDVESRPILFLGHSMGGLLIKQALINAHNNPDYSQIKDVTAGLAFFATPHHGGDWLLVSLGGVATKIAFAAGFQKGHDVLETLKEGSIFSDIMQEHWRHQLLRYNIISFWGALDNVVPRESVRFNMPGDRERVVQLNADHRGVCKFGPSQADQDNFKLVRSNIKNLYKTALKFAEKAEKAENQDWLVAEPQTKKVKRVKLLKRLYTSPYRDRKDRNSERIGGTCEWFTNHPLFRNWQGSKSSSLLWVSADPGCGKSVLAKYLVDDVLRSTETITTCYFFFKDDFDDQRSPASALCCILRQLFIQRTILLSDSILEKFETDGDKLMSSFRDLWDILISVTSDTRAGNIVCVLDALDECEENGQSALAGAIRKLYETEASTFVLKFLLTSRPYAHIRRQFQTLENRLPTIHLSGEDQVEVDKISREIDIVIKHRTEDLSARLQLQPEEQQILLNELIRVPNRTYLWVYLIFDVISNVIGITKNSLREDIRRLPKTVEAAYDKILCKSHDQQKAKRLLHIVVAAARPLSLGEIALALAIRESHRSYTDLVLEPEDRFCQTVRELCGLFVTIVDSKIYLLHQTAKEFLVQKESLDLASTPDCNTSHLQWRYSLRPAKSNRILAEICIWHLLFSEFEVSPLHESNRTGRMSQYADSHVFLDYSATHWAAHSRECHIANDTALLPSMLSICNPDSKRFLAWFKIYWARTGRDIPTRLTTLIVASYFGLNGVVKFLLGTGAINLNSIDNRYGRTPLSWAAENGHEAVVEILVTKGAKVNLKDKCGRTPLSWAAEKGHEAVVEILLAKGAEADSRDKRNQTPLFWAAGNGHVAVTKLLLEVGNINPNAKNHSSRTPLFEAISKGFKIVVELLISNDSIDLNCKGDNGWTPLSFAASSPRLEAIFELLLASDRVDLCAKDPLNGRTPLSIAAANGVVAAVELLLRQKSVDVNSRDKNGQTPLSIAISNGELAVADLILRRDDVDANLGDKNGRTPLSWAAERRLESLVKLLLNKKGVDVEARDENGRTPLSLAAGLSRWLVRRGQEAVVDLLLTTDGVNPNSKDKGSQTPLSWAARNGHDAVVRLLLANDGVNVSLRDEKGYTPLSWAARNGHDTVVKLLLAKDSDPNSKDNNGRTPLSLAAENGNETVVKILLAKEGIDYDSKDNDGRTPLSFAAGPRPWWCVDPYQEVAIEDGDVGPARPPWGGYSSPWRDGFYDHKKPPQLAPSALEKGQRAVVRLLLLLDGIDPESKDNNGRTPLCWAEDNRRWAIVELLRSVRRVK